MITHYHTSQSILCTYATTEHSPTEHYRTEHFNTEHYTIEHYKTEQYTTERYTMEQYTTGDYTTEHYTTEQNTTAHQRETPDLRITYPRGNIPKAKDNRQKRTAANRRRQSRFSPYGYGQRGHKATRVIKTHVKSSTQGHAVFEKIRK